MSYRENGHGDLRTDRSPWNLADLLRTTVLTAVVFFVYMVAAKNDEEAAATLQRLAEAERKQLAMPTHVAEAYQRGMADAVAAMQETPQGLALAQACNSVRQRP